MGQVKYVVPPGETFDVYVVEGRRKPRLVGTHPSEAKVPQEITVDGKSYYLGTMNVSERWLSYAEMTGAN